jgi:hypothetical protein
MVPVTVPANAGSAGRRAAVAQRTEAEWTVVAGTV